MGSDRRMLMLRVGGCVSKVMVLYVNIWGLVELSWVVGYLPTYLPTHTFTG